MIVKNYERRDDLEIREKGVNDFVTQADLTSEEMLLSVIQESYPDDAILSEESGASGDDDAERRWIIDPLDGTWNFMRGYPNFAISIGVEVRGRVEHGLIYHPLTRDLYTASYGRGAQLNGKRMRVGNHKKLSSCMASFGLNKHAEHYADYLPWINDIFVDTAGVRRIGSCALELAYVAAGFTDFYLINTTRPWDIAAGQLLIREAGGVVTNATGGTTLNDDTGLIACNPHLIRPILGSLKQHKLYG